jgi:hypothetical protein
MGRHGGTVYKDGSSELYGEWRWRGGALWSEMEMDVPSCGGSWWSMVLVVRWWVAVRWGEGGRKDLEKKKKGREL